MIAKITHVDEWRGQVVYILSSEEDGLNYCVFREDIANAYKRAPYVGRRVKVLAMKEGRKKIVGEAFVV